MMISVNRLTVKKVAKEEAEVALSKLNSGQLLITAMGLVLENKNFPPYQRSVLAEGLQLVIKLDNDSIYNRHYLFTHKEGVIDGTTQVTWENSRNTYRRHFVINSLRTTDIILITAHKTDK